MNIGPTQLVPVAGSQTSESMRSPARPAPSPGDPPKAEGRPIGNGEPALSLSHEVVKVHSDTSTGSPILVYEFVDSISGSLVFQIPSDQMLNLVQDIRQRLQRMAAKQSGGEK
jgi:hypothetical protein